LELGRVTATGNRIPGSVADAATPARHVNQNRSVDVASLTVNATTDRFQQALAPLRETFSGGNPSITTIGVQALYAPDYQLEVEMVVRVP
jgi:hypothetical protein